jgi:uncharacterized protein YdaU (DUF1376 family)
VELGAKVKDNEGVGAAVTAPNHISADEVSEDMTTPINKRTTSPAFQFYPRDFLSSSKVDRMSMTERGVYITLLARCWMDDGLPTDLAELAGLCRMKVAQFERTWNNGPLGKCFIERKGQYHNERLDRERAGQLEYRRRQSDNAARRWQSHRIATALPPTEVSHDSGNALQSASASTSSSASKKKDISAEPQGDSTPVVMTFPVVGNPDQQEWPLHQSRVDAWIVAYPNLDVLSECRKAVAWAEANPGRRKTGKGMAAFLVNWLNNASNRGGTLATSPSVNRNSKTAGNDDVFRRFIERGRTA